MHMFQQVFVGQSKRMQEHVGNAQQLYEKSTNRCLHMYVCAYTDVCMNACMCIHRCMYVFICMYVFMCVIRVYVCNVCLYVCRPMHVCSVFRVLFV